MEVLLGNGENVLSLWINDGKDCGPVVTYAFTTRHIFGGRCAVVCLCYCNIFDVATVALSLLEFAAGDTSTHIRGKEISLVDTSSGRFYS